MELGSSNKRKEIDMLADPQGGELSLDRHVSLGFLLGVRGERGKKGDDDEISDREKYGAGDAGNPAFC